MFPLLPRLAGRPGGVLGGGACDFKKGSNNLANGEGSGGPGTRQEARSAAWPGPAQRAPQASPEGVVWLGQSLGESGGGAAVRFLAAVTAGPEQSHCEGGSPPRLRSRGLHPQAAGCIPQGSWPRAAAPARGGQEAGRLTPKAMRAPPPPATPHCLSHYQINPLGIDSRIGPRPPYPVISPRPPALSPTRGTSQLSMVGGEEAGVLWPLSGTSQVIWSPAVAGHAGCPGQLMVGTWGPRVSLCFSPVPRCFEASRYPLRHHKKTARQRGNRLLATDIGR